MRYDIFASEFGGVRRPSVLAVGLVQLKRGTKLCRKPKVVLLPAPHRRPQMPNELYLERGRLRHLPLAPPSPTLPLPPQTSLSVSIDILFTFPSFATERARRVLARVRLKNTKGLLIL